MVGESMYLSTLDTYQNSEGQKVTDQKITNRYTSNFRDTSSISPIIVGAGCIDLRNCQRTFR